MMDNKELEELIRQDIAVGLAGAPRLDDGEPQPPIFAPVGGVGRRTRELPGVTVSVVDARRGRMAVEWSYKCTHVGHLGGLRPTGKNLTIHGVTIVDLRDEGSPRFRRYVDWADVMSRLDVTATFRPSFKSLDDIPGFGEIVLDPDARKGKPRASD
jgi:hypothetical protein